MVANVKEREKFASLEPLKTLDLPERFGPKEQGKVCDIWHFDGLIILVRTDRLSAFDRIIGHIPGRGALLNLQSSFWFENTKDIIDNHVIAVPHPRVTIAKECEPTFPVEMVVRGYITGSTDTSLWVNYGKGLDPYGLNLPSGLKKNQKLPDPVVTPTTKGEYGEHDVPLTKEECLKRWGEEYEWVEKKALVLYVRGSEICERQDLILADTKYELREKLLTDEVHTPDSSRFWDKDDWQRSFVEGRDPREKSKEHARKFLRSQGYSGEGEPPPLPTEIVKQTLQEYIEVYERITGKRFELAPDISSPSATAAAIEDFFPA